MDDANAIKLKRVIEQQHGGTSSFVKSVRVHQTNGNRADWDGVVYVFDLKGHPKAKRAFAWSSHIAGSPKDRFFAVLQMGPVTTPVQAVKAASAAIRKWGAQGTKR